MTEKERMLSGKIYCPFKVGGYHSPCCALYSGASQRCRYPQIESGVCKRAHRDCCQKLRQQSFFDERYQRNIPHSFQYSAIYFSASSGESSYFS